MRTHRSLSPLARAVLPVVALASACAQAPAEGGFQNPTVTAADAAAPASDASRASETSSPAPTPTDTPSPDEPEVALPFLVSDEFIASGYMGDGQPAMDGIKMTATAADCKTPRASGASGECYTINWTPPLTGGEPSGATSWAGVYWLSPANNWGAKPGKRVAKGATKVSFYAAGANGGEKVQLRVGGINTKGGDPSLTHRDSFTEGTDITLSTTWTKYEVPLSGATYGEVLGGFAWFTTATVPGRVTFYIDDVRWEK